MRTPSFDPGFVDRRSVPVFDHGTAGRGTLTPASPTSAGLPLSAPNLPTKGPRVANRRVVGGTPCVVGGTPCVVGGTGRVIGGMW